MSEELPTLDLSDLLDGMLGLTPEVAATFVQAATVCLESNSHLPGAVLRCTGHKTAPHQLHWPTYPDPLQVSRSWEDAQFATECGAYAVAIALVKKLASKVVCSRSAKGPGFDFWLCDADTTPAPFMFQGTSRLEVSGIFKGDSQVTSRVKQKVAQIKPSNGTGCDAYVVVVEFGSPQACVAYQ